MTGLLAGIVCVSSFLRLHSHLVQIGPGVVAVGLGRVGLIPIPVGKAQPDHPPPPGAQVHLAVSPAQVVPALGRVGPLVPVPELLLAIDLDLEEVIPIAGGLRLVRVYLPGNV